MSKTSSYRMSQRMFQVIHCLLITAQLLRHCWYVKTRQVWVNQRAEGRVLVVVSKNMHKLIQGPSCKLPYFPRSAVNFLEKNGSSLLPDLGCALGASPLLHPPKAGTGVKGQKSQAEPSLYDTCYPPSKKMSGESSVPDITGAAWMILGVSKRWEYLFFHLLLTSRTHVQIF